jgi:NADPH:quinone reductase-like Zn-dependent oxidoreductase
MRAIAVTEYGGPEALHEVDADPEEVGAGQVRVRVAAAAVNPTDTMVRNGRRADSPRAQTFDVPGMDVCGIVSEVGDGVDELAVGDRVVAVVVPAGEHGAYREDVVLPVASVVPAPAAVSDVEAATLPMNALTARIALDAVDPPSGGVVAVTGAAGAFGGYAVQLAKADGLTVVADAKESDRALIEGLGADVVLPRGDGFAAAVRDRFPDGVDALLDGSLQAAEVTPAVRDGGAVATVRGWDGDDDERLSYHPVMVRDAAERRDLLDRLRRQADAGQLALRVADVLPAVEADEAHRRLEAGGVRGRLVLDFT